MHAAVPQLQRDFTLRYAYSRVQHLADRDGQKVVRSTICFAHPLIDCLELLHLFLSLGNRRRSRGDGAVPCRTKRCQKRTAHVERNVQIRSCLHEQAAYRPTSAQTGYSQRSGSVNILAVRIGVQTQQHLHDWFAGQ